jgi:MFS family permease
MFKVWLAAALVSQLGDAALYFALGWAATGFGGARAGLVLSAVSLPRFLLLLLGGAVGDRWGARRIMICCDALMQIMICCDALMLVVSAGLALVVSLRGVVFGVLVFGALLIGASDAFYLPSAGSMPRVLVDDAVLSRALALRQAGSQASALIGEPLGGLLVASAGLGAAAAFDTVTFAAVHAVLVANRPVSQARLALRPAPSSGRNRQGSAARPSVLAAVVDGLRVAARTPTLPVALCLASVAAGLVIPVGSLLIPLLVREHGWSAGVAGAVVGAQSAGAIAVTLAVARFGTRRWVGRTALVGLLAVAVGLVALSLSTTVWQSVGAAAAVGIGMGVFVTHLTPVLLTTAPRTHLARVQSLLSLAQAGALLLTSAALGRAAHVWSASAVLRGCAAGLLVAAAGCAARRDIRQLHVTDEPVT